MKKFLFLCILICGLEHHSFGQFDAEWLNHPGLDVDSNNGPNDLIKSTNSGPSTQWDAFATSQNTLNAGDAGWLEFEAAANGYAVMIGFTSMTSVGQTSDLDHALTLFGGSGGASNHKFARHAGGIKQEDYITYSPGDRFRISFKSDGAIEFFHHPVGGAMTLLTALPAGTRVSGVDYRIGAAVYHVGGQVFNTKASFNSSGETIYTSYNWMSNSTAPDDSWSNGKIGINISGKPSYDLQVNGVTYLGGATPKIGLDNTYRLYVENGIRAERVKVDLTTTWADYVFERDYPLASLAEVKAFIDQYHHLPGIPDAATVEQEGIDLGEMNVLLLEKIEELTLHMIRLSEDNADLRQEIDEMKKIILTNQ